MQYIVWVVDDSPANQRMISRSFESVTGIVELRPIVSGAEFEERIRSAGASPQIRPHFILMDFFMGDSTGVSLVECVRQSNEALGRPVVIAHSSMKAASEAMVRAGADFVLPKTKGRERSEPLAALFRSLDRIQALHQDRRPPVGD